MMNDDENNKPQKKIQIFNNKDGTYTRKDFMDGNLVNTELGQISPDTDKSANSKLLDDIKNRRQTEFEERSNILDFIRNKHTEGMPHGWQKSPIAKQAFGEGFNEGYATAVQEYEKVLDIFRTTLELKANQEY